MTPITYIVLGAGGRGSIYSSYAAQFPEEARVVGVAEPRDYYRQRQVEAHNIPAENVFTDWRQVVEREKFADAVLICMQDNMHTEPAIAFARKGYHILLEKPMSPTEEECKQVTAAVKESGKVFAVGHVLRYTRYTQTLKRLLGEGVIGEVVSVQHLEPVGYWHQAHSFVRGNWRNEAESSFMLLAKSCHDLDWIRYIVGTRCEAVSSFGNLKHFRRENQPAGAADRCLECGVEADCPYSALKIYMGRVNRGDLEWPVDVITPEPGEAGVMAALRDGPYGRCVYACDNDVVDHQVVNFQFEGGVTATFTMTAFTEGTHRRTRIFGTRGELYGDGHTIRVFDFMTDTWTEYDAEAQGSVMTGHGGGDFGLMHAFVSAVAANDQELVLSGVDETLESHRMVFAAEQARRQGQVVRL